MAAKTLPPLASFVQLSLVFILVITVALWGAAFIGAETHRFASDIAQHLHTLIP